MSNLDKYAKVLWDYLRVNDLPVNSDIILCLCSHDTRVANRAAQLMLNGLGEYLVFSGGVGKLTRGIFDKSEAEIFSDIAINMGVPNDRVLIENASTNTGENIRFSYALLKKQNIPFTKLLLVQKPYMERRTFATFKKQWPDSTTIIHVTSPQMSYEEYLEGNISKQQFLNVMVGDMQRIREYPKLGFQIFQEIPDQVWVAYEELVKLGYDKHLIES